MTLLATRDLDVGYRVRRRERVVLTHVNVSAARGTLTCLLGANGTGKSTLLRTLAGMQTPLGGSIVLDGLDLATLSAAALARRVAVVLTGRVDVALTAEAVVALGRYAHTGWLGRPGAADRDVVSWAIDAAGVKHLADRHFDRLSDGERQRVMIARAMAQQPRVLLLDEPTAYLDAFSRIELVRVLRQLTRSDGLAVVMSTHDLELAMRTADRIWLVDPGGSIVNGAPEDPVVCGAIAGALEGHRWSVT